MAQKPRANANVREIVLRSDIVTVAEALGLKLDPKQSRPRKALCPFHDDRTPSLNLYQRAQDRDNFYCFACGAHGDIVDLVERRRNLEFRDAIKWLAPYAGVALAAGGWEAAPGRRSGAALFAERVREGSDNEELARFAERRGFSAVFLRNAGAGVYDLAALRREAATDRVLEQALRDAGILRPEPASGTDETARGWLRGFYRGKRIVFPLGLAGGAPSGFAARALGDEDPRYLYSFDFPRRSTLYGAERVDAWLRAPGQQGKDAHIYIVEGLFDQLRLESLGFAAVALLGSRAAAGQIEELRRLAARASESDCLLSFRLFLDPDAAGRDGAYDLIVALLRLLDGGAAFEVEVVVPPPLDDKADPDAYLRGQAPADAAAMLDEAAYTPFEFMLGVRSGQPLPLGDSASLTAVQRAAIARHIGQSLSGVAWDRVLAPLRVPAELETFKALIRSYGEGVSAAPGAVAVADEPAVGDPRADLITALTVGRSSTQRREYPLEDEAWERLAVAASPLFHLHRERLRSGEGPMAPLLARHLPKGGGRYRLKAGPVAADALLQQYALIELLRDRAGAPGFSNRIPAVRYDRNIDGKGIYRTGAEDGKEVEALSFAYQVDMGIVNGLAPPAREGIFRPYFECWRAFIDHLDAKLRRYRHEDLQILRLDITGFYEYVRRDVIANALQTPLEQALARFGQAEGGPRGFAPLLRPDADGDAAVRANVFTEFLLDHAFHNHHADPETGRPAELSGLPQGPDLSAYLANISLFDLDDMMGAEVRHIDKLYAPDEEDTLSAAGEGLEDSQAVDGARNRRGELFSAAYARYVDDIIIICPSAEVAGLWRRKIETHLQQRGLSLNRKNPTPALMTREEARAWLTDSRMGFGFSGPLADMPVTDEMDPLADAGDIDRRTALGLLFDPELDDLRHPGRIAERIERAFHATEVRFGDRANAYRRLWLIAAGLQDAEPADLVHVFQSEARRADIRARTIEKPVDVALAAIEAIERALRAPIPEALDEDARDCWADRRLRLALAVLGDIFAPTASEFLGAEARDFLERYDVRCQIAIIACLALATCKSANIVTGERPFAALNSYLAASGGRNPLPDGLRLSLFLHDGAVRPRLPEVAVPAEEQTRRGFYRLEHALVELQRFDEGAASGVEDLPPARPADAAATGIEQAVANILKIWQPGEGEDLSPVDPIEIDAAATLVNVTYRRFALVARVRPRLLRLIANQDKAVALPSPPGLEASGVMLWCGGNVLIFAAADPDAVRPIGVEWHAETPGERDFLSQWRAALAPGVRPLFDLEKTWEAQDIASIYMAGHRRLRDLLDAMEEEIPVPTAFSFFAAVGADAAIDHETASLICWTARREAVDGHAFVRNGSALEARSVHSRGADYWRYGWAVRDLCRRPEGPAETVEAFEIHGDTKLDRAGHRRDAILARVLPRLSGADRWGAGLALTKDAVPSRIERALRLLTAFGETDKADRQATYLIAATAEGLFMSERLGTIGDPSHSGRPAAIAARAARRASRALPAAGAVWSAGPPYERAGRRSASAWFAVARRVDTHLEGLDGTAELSLKALRLGLTLLGVTAELRALAFELASALPRQSLERLSVLAIDLSFAMPHLGGEIALIDEPDLRADGDPAVQVHDLLQTFGEIVAGRRTAAAAARDAITPLGWLILVTTLIQITPPADGPATGERPLLWRMTPESLERASGSVTALLSFVAASAADDAEDGHWPWKIFTPLADALPQDLHGHLLNLSAAASIRIETLRSAFNPRTGETIDGRPVLRLADGSSHRLSEWQIDVAYVAGERRLSTESESSDDGVHFRYSVSRNDDRVIGLHLVSQSLAETAFRTESDAISRPVSAANPDASSSTVPDEPLVLPAIAESAATEQPKAPLADADGGTGGSERRPPGTAVPERDVPPDEPQTPTDSSGADTIARIRKAQDDSWSERAKNGHDRQRLAIVQWDVADTYYAPGTADGNHEGLRTLTGEKPKKKQVQAGGAFQSMAEGRRRAILREVLRACDLFKVDGLVLPEYSVRAETVNWLTRQLQAKSLPLTIWAGTFRVPDGASISTRIPSSEASPYFMPLALGTEGANDWDAHSALLTCIDAVPSDRGMRISSTIRRKRYSSPAAPELIFPAVRDPWRPMLADENDPFRLGTYTIELVCSEMFLHASSANFIGILEENRKLASHYGLVWPVADSLQSLDDDMHVFARWTSYRSITEPLELVRGKALQRTIVILPAMSSRSADYHVFGQNQYLAAGLVTAFCNAVEPTAGVGGSAFIGLDGWKKAAEIATPYGSVAPGIFQLGGKHSGALEAKEAAMVIADIDPIRTTDLKPRPHYQGRSLELIAHLPLLFATEADASPNAQGTRNRVTRRRIVGREAMEFPEAARGILDVLNSREPNWRHEREAPHPDSDVEARRRAIVQQTAAALDILTQFADDPEWLFRRAKAFREKRWHFSPPMFLPALTDWLYVDDSWADKAIDLADRDPLEVDDDVLYVPRDCGMSFRGADD